MDPSPLLEPTLQYGFAGLSAGLLAALIWVVKLFLKAMEEHHQAVVALTKSTTAELHDSTSLIGAAFLKVHEAHAKQIEVLDLLHDKLLERPCILERELERYKVAFHAKEKAQ